MQSAKVIPFTKVGESLPFLGEVKPAATVPKERPPHRRLRWLAPLPVMTTSLFALNVFVYFIVARHSTDATLSHNDIFRWGAVYGPAVTHGESWRLLSAGALHFSFGHLFGNMIALWIGGPLLESWIGPVPFLITYVLSAIGASFGLLIGSPIAIGAGASGPVMGVFGALLAITIRRRDFRSRAAGRLGWRFAGFLVYPFAIDYLTSGASNVMHWGGLLTGFAVGLLLSMERGKKVVIDTKLSSLIVGSVGFILAGIGVMACPKIFDVTLSTQSMMKTDENSVQLVDSTIEGWRRGDISAAEFVSKMENEVLPPWVKLQARWESEGYVPAKFRGMVEDIRAYLPLRARYYRALADGVRGGKEPMAQPDVGELARQIQAKGEKIRAHFLILAAEPYGNSCDHGTMASCLAAGNFEENAGRPELAKRHFGLACEHHDVSACLSLARIELRENNSGEARMTTAGLCSEGNAEACSLLALAEEAAGQLDSAYGLHEGACRHGIAVSCERLAGMKEQRGEIAAAEDIYIGLCGKGSPASCYNAGRLKWDAHLHGEAGPYFQLACRQGFGTGCYGLAMLERETGHFQESQNRMAEACRLGVQSACHGRTPASSGDSRWRPVTAGLR